jgi:hypothetical protein
MRYKKESYRGIAYKGERDSDGLTTYTITSYTGIPLAEEVHAKGSKPSLCDIVDKAQPKLELGGD